MSLRSGFYNSYNGDRRYDSSDMSAIFNGIINDGVFASIGTSFAVSADTGKKVTVGIGRAWFNGKWIHNDSIMLLEADAAEVALDRYDAVVLEVDNRVSVRNSFIKIIKGDASSEAERPAMAKTDDVNQYPLAYIYRKAGSTEITQADITSMIGTSSCPFVTGILEVLAIDSIVAQWEAQWVRWFSNIEIENDTQMSELISEKQTQFDTWFNSLQLVLQGDVAVSMAAQIVELQNRVRVLEEEHWPTVEDSDGNAIKDSDGVAIESYISMV